jgi:hypothetical protein
MARLALPPSRCLLVPFAVALTTLPGLAQADEAAWQALCEGGIVLFRHAIAPGGGDPAGMRLGDCTTQRNLDAGDRDQARRIADATWAQPVVATLP